MQEKNWAGLDGFVWWLGVCENRKDPLGIGRCQVRIFGWHTDSLSDIPKADLPWASPAHSLNDNSFAAPKESEIIFGFFADGRSAQVPIMLGKIPGYETNPATTGSGFHDLREQIVIKYSPKKPVGASYNTDGSGIVVSEANIADPNVLESLRYPHAADLNKPTISGITRYDVGNTVLQQRRNNLDVNIVTADGISWSEPYPPYNTSYPFNQAIETESGHLFELDDTPKSERISFTHRTGTYYEMFPSGSVAEKVTKSKYTIVMSDDHIHIMGKALITVDGDCNLLVKGNSNIECGNDVNMKVAGSFNLSVGESFNVKADRVNFDIGSELDIVGGTQNYTASGAMNLIGAIQMDGVGSVNQGAAQPGSSAGISSAGSRLSPTTTEGTMEQIPLPLPGNIITFDPITGQAYKESLFKDTNDQGDLVEPTANTPSTLVCNFDPNAHTFITDKSQWNIGSKGLDLIKAKEGFSAVAYVDPATKAEPITIGYGSTASAIDRPVKLGDTVTKEQATEYLLYGIDKKFLPVLKRVVKVGLTQNMIDALMSLMYNIGGGNFASSTLVKKLNENDICGCADEFLVWNKAAGKVLSGLTTRRTEERELFLS